MAPNLTLDFGPGTGFEPRFEDGRRGAPVRGRQADDDLVFIGATNALDTGASAVQAGRLQSEQVEVAAKSKPRAVPKAASCGELGSVVSVPTQVTSQPGLPLDEECGNVPLGVRPAAAS